MELIPSLTTNYSIVAVLIITASSFFLWVSTLARRNKTSEKNKAPPQAGGAWPIIGHLHLLRGSKLPHVALGCMADKYGPIFRINLGVHQVVIVSDSQIAKECFTDGEKVFVNRPKSIAVEIMGYNNAVFGMGSYGPYWQKMRKLSVAELLSSHQLEKFSHARISEIKESIREIYQLWEEENLKGGDNINGVKVDMRKWFGLLTLNIFLKLVMGKRYSINDEDAKRPLKAIRKFTELLGTFVVGDSIPFVRFLDFGGYEKAMKENAQELDGVFQAWLEEHKAKKHSAITDHQHQDFMDVLLSTIDQDAPKEDFGGYDSESVIKATCLSLLAGAADTTMVTMIWALSLLVNNPHELKKVQDELDIHVGRNRQVEISDIKKLIYLEAITKESLRLYPAGQLLAPHESIEDCIIGGFYIRKGTRLVLNLSKIHRDPNIWENPGEFRPERFLTKHKDVDVKGRNFELLPFGSGRRMCPAINLGLQVMQLGLASLIHGFKIKTPNNKPTDMSEIPGLSNFKATPLDVYLTPRLSSFTYA